MNETFGVLSEQIQLVSTFYFIKRVSNFNAYLRINGQFWKIVPYVWNCEKSQTTEYFHTIKNGTLYSLFACNAFSPVSVFPDVSIAIESNAQIPCEKTISPKSPFASQDLHMTECALHPNTLLIVTRKVKSTGLPDLYTQLHTITADFTQSIWIYQFKKMPSTLFVSGLYYKDFTMGNRQFTFVVERVIDKQFFKYGKDSSCHLSKTV